MTRLITLGGGGGWRRVKIDGAYWESSQQVKEGEDWFEPVLNVHALLYPQSHRNAFFKLNLFKSVAKKFFLCCKNTEQAFAPPPPPCITTITSMHSVVDINIKSWEHLELLLHLRILILVLSNYNRQLWTIELCRIRNHDFVYCKLNIKVYSQFLLSIYML